MGRAVSTPEQWGQEKVFKVGELPAGKPQVVLTRDTPAVFENPQTVTLIAGVINEDADVAQDYALRWVLRSGVGGARTEVRFDATGFTRVSLPIEAFTLALETDPYPGGSDEPAGKVSAFAYVGEGGVGTDQDEGPIFTQFVSIPTASDAVIELPTGATAVRLSGQHLAVAPGPFLATTIFEIRRGTTVLATLAGRGAAPADPSMFTLFASGAWLPIPASATVIEISNAAGGTIECQVQFKLDL